MCLSTHRPARCRCRGAFAWDSSQGPRAVESKGLARTKWPPQLWDILMSRSTRQCPAQTPAAPPRGTPPPQAPTSRSAAKRAETSPASPPRPSRTVQAGKPYSSQNSPPTPVRDSVVHAGPGGCGGGIWVQPPGSGRALFAQREPWSRCDLVPRLAFCSSTPPSLWGAQ